MAKATKTYNVLTPDDILEIDESFSEEFYHRDVLLKALEHNTDILHDARKWGWSDTEVRESLGEACDKLGLDFEK